MYIIKICVIIYLLYKYAMENLNFILFLLFYISKIQNQIKFHKYHFCFEKKNHFS